MTPKFLRLQALMPKIEDAEVVYNLRIRDTYDDRKVAIATAEFNKLLVQAADAIICDLKLQENADKYLEEWRPRDATDTWFGLQPGTFLRHVLRDGIVHRMGLPDEATIH